LEELGGRYIERRHGSDAAGVDALAWWQFDATALFEKISADSAGIKSQGFIFTTM